MVGGGTAKQTQQCDGKGSKEEDYKQVCKQRMLKCITRRKMHSCPSDLKHAHKAFT